MNDQIRIELPKGGALYVKGTDEFMNKIKNHFELSDVKDVDHEHIRMYVYGALKNATDKAEKEIIK